MSRAGRRLPHQCLAACAWWLLPVLLLAAGGSASAPPVEPLASYASTQRLPELHHAVAVPLPTDWPTPVGLPLGPNRQLECRTCHGIKDMREQPYASIDTQAPDFLRGGPNARLEDFCYRCHDEDAFARPNIHVMLDAQGRIKEEHCTYCHEAVHRERDVPLTPDQYRLRLPPAKLCYGCHLKTPHFNAVEHQDAKPDAAMRQRIKEASQQLNVVLPLSDGSQLMCPTCHSPHQYGVIEALGNPAGTVVAASADPRQGIRYRPHSWDAVVRADKAQRLSEFNRQAGANLALEYRRIDREVLLRLPAKDGTLCLACHQFDD